MQEIITLILTLLVAWFGTTSTSESDPLPTEATQAVVTHVVDGDTIDVRIDGTEYRVRYIGIDTPEPYREGKPECYSFEASNRNIELVEGREVTLVADKENTDRYDRLLRYVYVDDVFINAKLIEEGYATTLQIKPNTSHAKEFRQLADQAKQSGTGLWGACT